MAIIFITALDRARFRCAVNRSNLVQFWKSVVILVAFSFLLLLREKKQKLDRDQMEGAMRSQTDCLFVP